QPAICLDFGVELARSPPGITERQQAAARAATRSHLLQDVQRRRERHFVVDPERARLQIVGGVEYETAALLHRSAEMNANLVMPLVGADIQLLQEIVEGDRIDSAVNHQSHGAL